MEAIFENRLPNGHLRQSGGALRRYIGGLVVSLVTVLSPLQSYAAPSADLVNRSADLGVLAQQLLIDFSMVGMQLNTEQSKARLAGTISRFDTGNGEIKGSEAASIAGGAVNELDGLWSQLKPKLTAEPSKELVAELFPGLEKLQKTSDQLVQQLGKEAGLANPEGFYLASRQRVLSQRMTALYMLMAWRVEKGGYADLFRQDVAEFKKNHLSLKSIAGGDPSMGEIEKHLMWYDKAANSTASNYVPTIIVRSGDKLLDALNGVASRQAGL